MQKIEQYLICALLRIVKLLSHHIIKMDAIKFHGDLKQKFQFPFKILWGECSIWLHSPPLFFLNQIRLFLHQMMFLNHQISSLLNHCILYLNHIFRICFESTIFYFVYVQSFAFHYHYI